MKDSLRLDYNTSWYRCAPAFAAYGKYMQSHFPMEYIKNYMVPNFQTLVKPELGEMADYLITPYTDPIIMDHYHLKDEYIKCKEDIYKIKTNKTVETIYYYALRLFALCSILLLIFAWRITPQLFKTVSVLITFTVLFYGLTLYSSWFLYRYIMPLYPIMYSVIILTIYLLIREKVWIRKTKPVKG
jgi:hypothetical protein